MTNQPGRRNRALSRELGRAAGRRPSEADQPDGTRERIQVPVGEKGGYDARGVLDHVGDPGAFLDWIDTQVGCRYQVAGGTIVAIDMSIW